MKVVETKKVMESLELWEVPFNFVEGLDNLVPMIGEPRNSYTVNFLVLWCNIFLKLRKLTCMLHGTCLTTYQLVNLIGSASFERIKCAQSSSYRVMSQFIQCA